MLPHMILTREEEVIMRACLSPVEKHYWGLEQGSFMDWNQPGGAGRLGGSNPETLDHVANKLDHDLEVAPSDTPTRVQRKHQVYLGLTTCNVEQVSTLEIFMRATKRLL